MLQVTAILVYLALLFLCLGYDRHYRQVFPGPRHPGRQRLFHRAGWVALALSLLLILWARPWGLALVDWLGLVTAGALALVFLLPYRPRWVALPAVVPAVSSLVALAF